MKTKEIREKNEEALEHEQHPDPDDHDRDGDLGEREARLPRPPIARELHWKSFSSAAGRSNVPSW